MRRTFNDMSELLPALTTIPDSISQILTQCCLAGWIRPQRIHPLRRLGRSHVLREDESGFGMSGSKRRKLASLIPFLKKQAIESVAVIGGANSNHVVAAVQALREHGFRPHAFLLENHQTDLRGNAWLSSLLLPEDDIFWVSRENWPTVDSLANAWAEAEAAPAFVLPEGGNCREALAGAATLPLSWEPKAYDHVWMDAGTGLSAAAAILMAGRLELSCQFQVVLVAGNETSFRQMLDQAAGWWAEVFQEKAPKPAAFTLHTPVTARSFGAVNATVWEEVRRLAREEGILADPVYTAKLFLTARAQIPQLSGQHLIIHGGGGTGLLGFSG